MVKKKKISHSIPSYGRVNCFCEDIGRVEISGARAKWRMCNAPSHSELADQLNCQQRSLTEPFFALPSHESRSLHRLSKMKSTILSFGCKLLAMPRERKSLGGRVSECGLAQKRINRPPPFGLILYRGRFPSSHALFLEDEALKDITTSTALCEALLFIFETVTGAIKLQFIFHFMVLYQRGLERYH